jgi:hypothetical protein
MFALELSSADVFQILDALDSRAEAWEYTSRQLSGTLNPDDEFRVPEECSDFSEAERIARHFRDIGVTLRSQIERQ